MKDLILASASPRRKALLEGAGFQVITKPQNLTELTYKKRPHAIVMDLAAQKLGNLPSQYPDRLIVAADTVVWANGRTIGKPTSRCGASEILRELSGKTHSVYTGFAVAYRGQRILGYARTDVTFYQLTEASIAAYVASGSPMDKAGAYGIQDGVCVARIKGSYENVVGLPTEEICAVIARLTE